MPTAAPKPCTQCGVLVRDGSSRCVDHKVKAGTFADSRRGSRHERGYGSAWDKTRERILKRDAGLCQPCLAQGIVHEGTHVDHKISKAEWRRVHGSLEGCDDDSNLQTINAECHKAKTQAEAAAARGLASHPHMPPAAAAGKTSGPGAPTRGAPGTGGQEAGGGEKSAAPVLGTERLAKFSRAQVSRGGCTAPAGETPAKRVGRFKLRVLP